MNDLDSDSGSYCHAMIDDAVNFDEAWYDWDISDIKDFVDKESKNNFVFVQFSYKELGRDEKWFRNQCRGLNNDLLKIKREILLEWTLTNDSSPFTEEQLAELQNYTVIDPIGKFYIFNKYRFNVYAEMHNILNKSWLVGVDVGGGLSNDFSVITIAEPSDRKIVAQFRSNSISVPDLSDLLVSLIRDFIPKGVLIPERNSLGITLIQLLLKTEASDNLYYEVKTVKGQKVVEDPKRRASSLANTKKQTRVYGVLTDISSRKIMIDEILNSVVNDEPWLITSPVTYEEIKGLEKDKKGKIQHRAKGHDDSLFSWLVLSYMALYGSNAKKFIKCTSNGLPKREDENGNRIIINKNAIDMRRLYNIALSDNGTERSMSDIVIEEYQKKRIVNKTFSETEDPNKKRKLNRFQEILDMNKR